MFDPAGPISITSYASGYNASQPDRDGSDWNDAWKSLDMTTVRDAINYFRMKTFSIVIVGKLYQGRDVVSRVGAITDMTSFHHAMYPGDAMIYPGHFMLYRTDSARPSGGTTEEICYKALDLLHMPVKIVGVILQKIS